MTEAHAGSEICSCCTSQGQACDRYDSGETSADGSGILKHTPRHAARVVEKIVRSAVANAELKEMGDSESMVISKAFVDCGPTYKRVRARSMGRANAIQKRTSHITVVVTAPETQDKRK